MPRPPFPVAADDLARVTGVRPASPARSLSASDTDDLLRAARTGDSAALAQEIFTAASSSGCGQAGVLLMAADPTTGQSLLHVAASAGNLGAIRAIREALGPNISLDHRRERVLHLVMTAQDRSDNTPLHAAAQAGSRDAVTAVYRMFCQDMLPDEGESAEPAESLVYEPGRTTDDDYVPRLHFVLTKNRAGRTAAEEARSASHDDVASWLDAIVAKLDPEGKTQELAEMQRLDAFVSEAYDYGATTD